MPRESGGKKKKAGAGDELEAATLGGWGTEASPPDGAGRAGSDLRDRLDPWKNQMSRSNSPRMVPVH